MQNGFMRTTVNLDDDVYELASVYASARGITLGSALGELLRTPNNPLSRSADPSFSWEGIDSGDGEGRFGGRG